MAIKDYDKGASTSSLIAACLPPATIIGLGYFIDWMRIQMYVGKEMDKWKTEKIQKKNQKQ